MAEESLDILDPVGGCGRPKKIIKSDRTGSSTVSPNRDPTFQQESLEWYA